MNYFAPGLRELARILDRLGRRARLLWERRKLAQSEGHLGLLGWQQADYDPDTQQHADRLAEYERSQLQLTNESAALGLAVQQLEEQRRSERATFDSQRTERLAAQKPLSKPIEESAKALADLRRERPKLEAQLGIVDKGVADREKNYRDLLSKGEVTPEEQTTVQEWQRQSLSIPHEKLTWRGRLNDLNESEARLQTELQEQRAALSAEIEALKNLEKSFAESDDALVKQIAAHKREKQKLERQINDFEKAKTHPYREIGRILADHRIEPLNQPEALSAVLVQREKILEQEAKMAASLEQSGQENREQVWSGWLIIMALAVLVFGAVWIAFHWR